MEIGQRIRLLRQQQKLTLEQVAARTGLDTGNLSRLERSLQGWTQDSLVKIAEALGVQVSSLFVGDDLAKVGEVTELGRLVGVSREYKKAKLDGCFVLNPLADDREGIVIKHATFDTAAYGLVIKGDSLRPRYKSGEYCIVEPMTQVRPGIDCVIELVNGMSLIREFFIRREDEIEFLDVASNERLTIPTAEIKSLAPIVGHYPAGSGMRAMGQAPPLSDSA
jgi:transcriptional regulator with XRE-family HTH domain